MIKLKALREFTLENFNKLKNIVRNNKEKNKEKTLYANDTFECDEKMAKYLTGENDNKIVVAEVIEVIPEKNIFPHDEGKELVIPLVNEEVITIISNKILEEVKPKKNKKLKNNK